LPATANRRERWTYYEIDPVVARIALDPHFFTFLRDCPPSLRIVLGDARLTLGKERHSRFDVLVLDAFSSDAISRSLLTREAFRAISRGWLRRESLRYTSATTTSTSSPSLHRCGGAGPHGRIRRDLVIPGDDAAQGRTPAIWTILARSPADFGPLLTTARWELLRRRADVNRLDGRLFEHRTRLRWR